MFLLWLFGICCFSCTGCFVAARVLAERRRSINYAMLRGHEEELDQDFLELGDDFDDEDEDTDEEEAAGHGHSGSVEEFTFRQDRTPRTPNSVRDGVTAGSASWVAEMDAEIAEFDKLTGHLVTPGSERPQSPTLIGGAGASPSSCQHQWRQTLEMELSQRLASPPLQG